MGAARPLRVRNRRSAGPVYNPVATAEFYRAPRYGSYAEQDEFKTHAWVYACVNAIAMNIASVPFQIKAGLKKSSVVVENGPWVDLFDRPNPVLTRQQFWFTVIALLETCGGCMLVKESRENRRIQRDEIPFELWPVNYRLFKPVLNPSTNRLIGWMFMSNLGKPVWYETWEVCPIYYPDPKALLEAIAPLDAAKAAVRQDRKASEFNEAFFDNDASPGGVLISKSDLGDDARRELREAWEERHQGPRRAHRMALIEGDITWQQNQQTHDDMQFLEQRKWTREEVLAVYKVPKAEVALYEDINNATAKSADKTFWTKKLEPVQTLVEDSLYGSVFKEPGRGLVRGAFDNSQVEALGEDLDLKLTQMEKFQKAGFPVNKVNKRLDLGMEPVEGGDTPLVASTLKTLDSVVNPPAVPDVFGGDPAGGFPPGKKPADGHDPGAEPAPDEGPIGLESKVVIAQRAVTGLLRGQGAGRAKKWQMLVKSVMVPGEARFQGRVKSYLNQLRAESVRLVEENLKAHPREAMIALMARGPVGDAPEEAAPDNVLFDLNRWNQKLASQVRPLYAPVIQAAADFTAEELGGTFNYDPIDKRVTDIVKARTQKIVGLNDQVRRRLSRSIGEGLQQGETVQEIADRIRQDFNQIRPGKALTVARTEVGGATNEARFMVLEGEGVEEHTWVTAHDEAVRESHRELDGETVAIGEEFGDSGLTFPGDPDGEPGEVINCRCITVAKL